MAERNEEWHLNKSVPITLIVTIFVQTVAVVWFASELRFDVNHNKTEIVRNEARLDVLERLINKQAVTLGRMDENLSEIRRTLKRMESRGGPLP